MLRVSFAAAVLLCLLALPGGRADHDVDVYSRETGSPIAASGSITETDARNPLDYVGDDEMYTHDMENHYHCLERDDWEMFQYDGFWPWTTKPIRSQDAYSMLCCDDSSYTTPCREVWCIHSPGQQILNAWSDVDRCKRIGGVYGSNAAGKKACCAAGCSSCGGSTCAAETPGADGCCLEQIIDKTTTNITTGVVTTYPNVDCGTPPCVLKKDLTFPTGYSTGLYSTPVNYASSKCHVTSGTNIKKMLAYMKVSAIDSTMSAITSIKKDGDAVYVVSVDKTSLEQDTTQQSQATGVNTKLWKFKESNGQTMWPQPILLADHMVGPPLASTDGKHFFITTTKGKVSKYTNPQNRYTNTADDQYVAGTPDTFDVQPTSVWIQNANNQANIVVHQGAAIQKLTPAFANDQDFTTRATKIVAGKQCGATFTGLGLLAASAQECMKMVKARSDCNHKFFNLATVDKHCGCVTDLASTCGAADQVITTAGQNTTVDLWQISQGCQDATGSSAYSEKMPADLTGEQVCEKKGFDEAQCLSIGSCCKWEAMLDIGRINSPNSPGTCVSNIGGDVCVSNDLDCSIYAVDGTRNRHECTPEASSKCCACGRGEYLVLNARGKVIVMDAGNGEIDVASNAVTSSQFFTVPSGTHAQVTARCGAQGGTLAVITTAAENTKVMDLCKTLRNSGGKLYIACYIGLVRPAVAGFVAAYGPHEWVDGSPVIYENWVASNLAGEPGARILTSDGKWDDTVVLGEFPGVCAKSVPTNEVFSNTQESGSFTGVEWGNNDDVATTFYKVDGTPSLDSPNTLTGYRLSIPGAVVKKFIKGVGLEVQKNAAFSPIDGCMEYSKSSHKYEADSDCCARGSSGGCALGYTQFQSSESDTRAATTGSKGLSACAGSNADGSLRVTKCKPSQHTTFDSVFYTLPSVTGGPFTWRVKGNTNTPHEIQVRDQEGSILWKMYTVGNKVYMRHDLKAYTSATTIADHTTAADSHGGFKRACANLDGVWSFSGDNLLCCPAACVSCGGADCSGRTGGAAHCCDSNVLTTDTCDHDTAPPCTLKAQNGAGSASDPWEAWSTPAELTWASADTKGLLSNPTTAGDFEWTLKLHKVASTWMWELHADGVKKLDLKADPRQNIEDAHELINSGKTGKHDMVITATTLAQLQPRVMSTAMTKLRNGVVWIYGTAGLFAVKEDGTELWKAQEDGNAVASEPMFSDTGAVVYGYGTSFVCRNETSGDLLWTQILAGAAISPAAMHGSDVYVTTDTPTVLYRFGLTSNSTLTTYPVGDNSGGLHNLANPVMTQDGNFIYVSQGGNMYKISVSSGILG